MPKMHVDRGESSYESMAMASRQKPFLQELRMGGALIGCPCTQNERAKNELHGFQSHGHHDLGSIL